MEYNEYQKLFDDILAGVVTGVPYNDEFYLNYTKLNKARMKRWDNKKEIPKGVVNLLSKMRSNHHWIIITEPWCGDAAHVVPFLVEMSSICPNATYDIQLRDSAPYLINNYLTDGSKGIPKLIIRDKEGNDVITWGPRPQGAQILRDSLVKQGCDIEFIRAELQKWYNENEGAAICTEIAELLMHKTGMN